MIKRIKTNYLPAVILLACGVYGLVASFVLTMEKMALLQDPTSTPSCSLNPIVTCASAIDSPQAMTFGIPNSMFGIITYTSLVVVAGLLLADARFSRVIWNMILVAAVLGFLGMMWLLTQSIFVLHVICPWCFGVWLTTPLVLLAVSVLYVRHNDNPAWYGQSAAWMATHTKMVAVMWYAALVLVILWVFWEFWSSLL